jgi:hypothetical protein
MLRALEELSLIGKINVKVEAFRKLIAKVEDQSVFDNSWVMQFFPFQSLLSPIRQSPIELL